MSQKGLFASVSGWPNIERKKSPKSDFGTEELGGRDHTHSPATTHTYIYIYMYFYKPHMYIYIYLFIYFILFTCIDYIIRFAVLALPGAQGHFKAYC